ncbi:MAG: SPOR domain-containing protein [Myxococcota bacterium]
MRDLEQIQEQEDNGGRRIVTLMMAALATVALVLAMGVMLGQSSEAAREEDPLAILEELEGLALESESPAEEERPEVDREALTFPAALGTYDRRPEVEAAVAAAAAELAHPDPIGSPTANLTGGLPVGFGSRAPSLPVEAALPAHLPAATAASHLADTLHHQRLTDPMVSDALPPEPPRQAPAAPGSDGRYTLQVISYQNPTEAEAFAEALRARGHSAFVVSADIPDRGMHWRVRIGPFETMREAESYRQSFEADEGMNTFVVRRRDDA